MARPGASYPQADAGAVGLMDHRVAACPPARRVGRALEVARDAGAEVLLLGHRAAVRHGELERAARWGLDGLAAEALAWSALPVVSTAASEIEVRRLLLAGSPMVLVKEGRTVVGVVDAERVELARPALSLAHRLERMDSRASESGLWLCRVAGKVGEGIGVGVYAVGGFVRDLLLQRRAPDVDLVVEGDGMAFARRLVEEVGGTLTLHPKFGTAFIEGAGRGGMSTGRIDIASARREEYERPGALPAVTAATIEEDLRRRDFSVNAMAMVLAPETFGRLLDPLGGQLDLKRRRLRPLSPLSFVEDPTRIFRAARYAARLGLRVDERGRRALRLALSIGEYPALSGQRLRAELELLAAEESGWRGVELLVGWGAFTLWDVDFRASARTVARVRAGGRLGAWAHGRGITIDDADLMLITLLADQRASVVERCLGRLALSGEPRARLRRAVNARPLAGRLDGSGTMLAHPSRVAGLLDPCPVEVLVGIWLHGGPRARRRVEQFLEHGRTTRPRLSGDEVISLGVARGPDVGTCLAALRRQRLDGELSTIGEERAFVKAWLGARAAGRGDAGARGNRRVS